MKHYIVFILALVLSIVTFAAGQETLVSIDLARKNATAMSLVWTEHQSTSIRLNVKRNGEDFDLTGWENRLVIGDGTTGLVVTGAQTGYGDCVFTVDPASIPTNGRYSVAITAEQGYHTEEWARGVLRVELDHGVNYMPTSWYGWEKVARLAATFVDSNNVVSVNGKHGNVELGAHDVNAYTQDETDTKIGAHGSRTDNPHGVTAEQAGAYTKAAVDGLIANHAGRTDNPHGVTAAQAGAYSKAETDAKIAEVETKVYTPTKDGYICGDGNIYEKRTEQVEYYSSSDFGKFYKQSGESEVTYTNTAGNVRLIVDFWSNEASLRRPGDYWAIPTEFNVDTAIDFISDNYWYSFYKQTETRTYYAVVGKVAKEAQLSGYVPVTRKVNSKPLSSDITLTPGDVGAVPTTRKVNNKPLSADVTLAPGDIGAVPTTRKVNGLALSGDITITTVGHADEADHADSADNATRATTAGSADAVTWQHVSGKPTTLNGYGITDAVPSTRTVNGKALSANVTLAPADVGAVPTTRTINGKALSANVTLAPADIGAVAPAAIADMETLTHAGQTYATKTAVADVEDQVDEIAEAVGELEAKIGDAVIKIVDGKPVLFAIE